MIRTASVLLEGRDYRERSSSLQEKFVKIPPSCAPALLGSVFPDCLQVKILWVGWTRGEGQALRSARRRQNDGFSRRSATTPENLDRGTESGLLLGFCSSILPIPVYGSQLMLRNLPDMLRIVRHRGSLCWRASGRTRLRLRDLLPAHGHLGLGGGWGYRGRGQGTG